MSSELSTPAQCRIWLRLALAVYDRVQEQITDTGCGTLAKRSFDSPGKSIYTSLDEGEGAIPVRTVAMTEEDVL